VFGDRIAAVEFIMDRNAKKLRKWVNNRLHEIMGASQDAIIDFVISKAKRAASRQELLATLKNFDIPIDDNTRRFCGQLYSKVPHENQIRKDEEKKRRNKYQKEVEGRMALTKDYGLVETDSEEEAMNEKRERKKLKKQKKALKKKEKELKRREKEAKKQRKTKRRRSESFGSGDSSDAEFGRASRGTRPPPRKRKKRTKSEEMEEQRIRDLEEKAELEERMKQKEAEAKKKRALAKLTEEERKAMEENRKRKKIGEMNDKEKELELLKAKDYSRYEYLGKRVVDVKELLEEEIRFEEETFKSMTKEEEENLDDLKKRLTMYEETEKLMDDQSERYVMPASSAYQVRNKKSDLLNRYTESKNDTKTDQWSWEEAKIKATAVQRKGGFNQGNFELLIEDQEEIIKEELKAGFKPEVEIEEEKVLKPAEIREQTKLTLSEQRNSLPIYPYRQAILDAIEEYQILIITAETGSGKTTQLPQYLFEAGYGKNGRKIAITQPRRVACMSVAKRVSDEMGVRLGQEVGYCIRFEDNTSDRTILKYLTDGMLLKEFLMQPDLEDYCAVMIDEAHERTLHTDVLFGLVKDVARERTDLKLIISSATLDAEKFSDFFDEAPIFNVPGRKYHVDVYHTIAPEGDRINACIKQIMQIHISQPVPGDILVFLTGQAEIEHILERLLDYRKKFGKKIKELIPLPIYANLPSEKQAEIFRPTPPQARKVVLATNIAETSLTIRGITFVIDPGMHKLNTYNPRSGVSALVVTPISQAAAEQRKGRAGRIDHGKCFRLYTRQAYEEELPANTPPEITRVNLGNVVLMLKSLGINDFIHFDYMDPPPQEMLIKALEQLYALNALNHKGELTKLGRRMAEFPLDPQLSKAIVESENYDCAEQVLTIASMLSANSAIFFRPKSDMVAADTAHKQFWSEWGDHGTLLKVYEEWTEVKENKMNDKEWCRTCYIQWRSLNRAFKVREQLAMLAERVEIEETSTDDSEAIRKALLSGFFYNVAKLDNGMYRTVVGRGRLNAELHPSGCLFQKEPPVLMVMFNELMLTSTEYMRTCSAIEPEWLHEVAPHYFKETMIQNWKQEKKPKRRQYRKKTEI